MNVSHALRIAMKAFTLIHNRTEMNKITENKCNNCALCSFVCASNRIECDVDNHVINDECEEGCEDYFVEDEVELQK